MPPKQIMNVILIILTIGLMAYSVYLAIQGDKSLATYCLVWSLATFLVARPIVA